MAEKNLSSIHDTLSLLHKALESDKTREILFIAKESDAWNAFLNKVLSLKNIDAKHFAQLSLIIKELNKEGFPVHDQTMALLLYKAGKLDEVYAMIDSGRIETRHAPEFKNLHTDYVLANYAKNETEKFTSLEWDIVLKKHSDTLTNEEILKIIEKSNSVALLENYAENIISLKASNDLIASILLIWIKLGVYSANSLNIARSLISSQPSSTSPLVKALSTLDKKVRTMMLIWLVASSPKIKDETLETIAPIRDYIQASDIDKFFFESVSPGTLYNFMDNAKYLLKDIAKVFSTASRIIDSPTIKTQYCIIWAINQIDFIKHLQDRGQSAPAKNSKAELTQKMRKWKLRLDELPERASLVIDSFESFQSIILSVVQQTMVSKNISPPVGSQKKESPHASNSIADPSHEMVPLTQACEVQPEQVNEDFNDSTVDTKASEKTLHFETSSVDTQNTLQHDADMPIHDSGEDNIEVQTMPMRAPHDDVLRSEHASTIDELYAKMESLKRKYEEMTAERDNFRDKYYALLEKNQETQSKYTALLEKHNS